MFFPKSRIVTIVGHYGSGKSEVAINIALLFAAVRDTFLADFDIVNPYFRSREVADFLFEKNVRVICTAEEFKGVDLPYMPSDIMQVFQNEYSHGVIDAGGDAAGAKVLARYSDEIRSAGSEVYFVINGNRPQTKTASQIIKHINDIQGASGLRITGLINNTHLLGDTDLDDVIWGSELTREVSRLTNIPVSAHAISKNLLEREDSRITEVIDNSDELMPVDIYLRKPWEE